MLYELHLLPLNRRRRLTGYVINHPGNTGYLIDNPVTHPLHHFIRQVCPAGRHKDDGLNGPYSDDPFIATTVADYANRFNRQEDSKGLGRFVIPVSAVQLFNKDGVGFTQQISVFLFDFTQDPGTILLLIWMGGLLRWLWPK